LVYIYKRYLCYDLYIVVKKKSGIKCASGAVALIPIGIIFNLIGIPLVLILEKNIRKKNN